MSRRPVIIWFHRDLRVEDHPALAAALQRGKPVVALYTWSPEEEGRWPLGTAARWWLQRSLIALGRELRSRGNQLVIRSGPSLDAVLQVAAETGADSVFSLRRYEPEILRRDRRVLQGLERAGIRWEVFPGDLLFGDRMETARGGAYRVFGRFWKACLATAPPVRSWTTPDTIVSTGQVLDSESPGIIDPEGASDSAGHLWSIWSPGVEGAQAEMNRLLDEVLSGYSNERDRPDRAATSRLSPHLAFGELSPRQVWSGVRAHVRETGNMRGEAAFLRQLGWREFAYHTLLHEPELTSRPLRPAFAGMPWRMSPASYDRWRFGRTGYPFVDAAMRELFATGWLNNRARMIAASFLVKDLHLPWQAGQAWFWERLVDADLASNAFNWQWVAGCGLDSTPFFRIFNPVRQGLQFDPDGDYVRRWVPELGGLPASTLHAPWEASERELLAAGVRLGDTYPRPIVDHEKSRRETLAAYEKIGLKQVV